jgi:hypothetical protein
MSWSAECPSCEAEIEYGWTPGKCPHCGLLYVVEQDGETWSGDEYPVAIFETEHAMRNLYGVVQLSFDNHPEKLIDQDGGKR